MRKPLVPTSLAIMLVFALHALVVGSLYARIAEVQLAIGLDEAQFGLVLMGIPAGVMAMSLNTGRVLAALGPSTVLRFLPVFALSPILVALSFNMVTVALALAAVGAGLALINVAMNVEADRIEAASGRRIMSRCHGSWGLGFLATSMVGAGAVRVGVPPVPFFVLVFGATLVASILIVTPMQPAPPREEAGKPQSRFALPTLPVVLLMGFALSGIWLEGATRNWSVIYTRDVTGAVDWLATLALTAIVSTQTLGRFLGDGWVERFGVITVGRALMLTTLVGLALVVVAPVPLPALIGFALIGLGISLVHPLSISAAARLGDRPAAENVAAFSFLQTMIGFASPPILGLLASQTSLRIAFACMLILPLTSLVFARHIAPGEPLAKADKAH